MNRRRSVDGAPVTSIIQKIVIYDKPNKPSIPEEICPQRSPFRLGNGDIILSCPGDATKQRNVDINMQNVKSEVMECDAEDSVLVKNEHCELDNLDEAHSEGEELDTVQVNTLFKTPRCEPVKKGRGRPKKQVPAPQKSTLLNFVTKQSKPNASPLNTTSDTSTRSPAEEGRQKRVRRIPQKYNDEDILVDGTSLGHYTHEEVVLSPQDQMNNKELSSVPADDFSSLVTGSTADEIVIERLLDEADEHTTIINEMQTELQSLVSADPPTKKTVSSKNPENEKTVKTPLVRKCKQRKKSRLVETRKIKRETEDDEGSLIDGLQELSYSDDDSRREWEPEEYVEYKKALIMKKIKMHTCKFCDSEFSTYYSLRKHRALAHDDVGRDRKESTYKGVNHSKETQEEGEGEEQSDEERGEWMPEDYAEYKMKHSMNKMKRVMWYKCKICCAVFSNYYKLSKHKVEHERKADPYECKQCIAKFNNLDLLTAHIRTHQGKDPYQCKTCGKGFKTKDELSNHAQVHILKKVPIAIKKFRCDVCGKEFGKLSDIERHTRVHTGEKPCECNICHKRFQQAHNLSKHLLIHLHVKPFQCEICNKKFSRVDVLNRHILTHSLEKPFKCVFCGKGFIRQVQLTNHTNKSHPDEDENLMKLASENDEVIVTPITQALNSRKR